MSDTRKDDNEIIPPNSLDNKNQTKTEYCEIDIGQLDKMINDCKVVLVEVPEFEINGENQIMVPEEFSELEGNQTEGPHTIFIEVPQAVAEETIGSSTSSDASFKSKYSSETFETDPLAIKEEKYAMVENEAFFKEKQTMAAVEKPEKQRIAVKKLANLTPKVFQQSPVEIRRRDRHFRRVGNARPVAKTSKVETTPVNGDIGKSNDLMWLLNFKLDDLIKGSVLDEGPKLTNPSDEKKGDAGAQSLINKSKPASQIKTEPSNESRKKPPFTYTELIEGALYEKGPLTVSEIYQWISDTFPYYKAWDDRWKNSVRHNLSINPYFRKGSKARQGAGHLWTVSDFVEHSKFSNVQKRQRYQEFEAYTKRIKMECESDKNSAKTAAQDAEHEEELEAAREAAFAAATIENKENYEMQHGAQSCPSQNFSLEQSAEEILRGVKRNVAVEYIEPPRDDTSSSNDFLNPVSKEDLMGECGFLNQIELNLTAESTEHMEIVESEQVFEHLEDLGFQFTDVVQCPQLLSLVN